MTRRIFILVPSPHPTGPIKGAYALANALVEERSVTLVTIKPGPGAESPLDQRVEYRSLAGVQGTWRSRLQVYRKLLRDAGGRSRTASISMCLSADFINRFCASDAITCASVRGNLLRNYRMDYGVAGVPLAAMHLAGLRSVDHVVAISSAMARQVAFYTRRTPSVIGNFVDEEALEPYRRRNAASGEWRFVFVASLTARKQPMLALDAIDQLRKRGVSARLDIIGDGPMRSAVAEMIAGRNLGAVVTMHGHQSDPYSSIAAADVMVLPSLSEGLARSALEALHLGIPAVLRDVDGNAELVSDPACGGLFQKDDELPEVMIAAAERSRRTGGTRDSLLKPEYRQHHAAHRYLELVERES